MASEGPKFGELVKGEAHRDAVHVAVAPVAAGEVLEPGQRVSLGEDGRAVARFDMNLELGYVGIVDPFLSYPVNRGRRFWLFLMPNTVTGMRHQWSHPSFPDARNDGAGLGVTIEPPAFDQRKAFEDALAKDPLDEATRKVYADWLEDHEDYAGAQKQRSWSRERHDAEAWLRAFAERANVSYEEVVRAAHEHLDTGECYVQYGEEGARDAMHDDRQAFWDAFEKLTGRKLSDDDRKKTVFSCSC